MGQLALNGGRPVRNKPFAPYRTLGSEELKAATEVMEEGILSGFLARDCPEFYGGKKVRELEQAWADYFGVKYAIAMNSATSCLYAAMGAIGIGPGDEVIVSPFSHCVSATCPLAYQAIPVFADVEDSYFCLAVESVRARLSPRTRAILLVDTFGQSSEMDAVNTLAKEHGLWVVSDAAHAPGALYKKEYAGTLADIGIYSLNVHKIIQSGEGGIAVTNNDDLALRLRLIRNHAEAVVGEMGVVDLTNMLGQNYRMTELEAAIAREQLRKLPRLIQQRLDLASHLTHRLAQIPGFSPPQTRPDCTHVYYLYPIKYDHNATGIRRNLLLKAVQAEGIPLHRMAAGYVQPLYLEPLFSRRTVFKGGYPFRSPFCHPSVWYGKGLCPVTERLHEGELIVNHLCYPPLTEVDMDDIANAFEKVLERQSELSSPGELA